MVRAKDQSRALRICFVALGVIYIACSFVSLPLITTNETQSLSANFHELSLYARLVMLTVLFGVYKALRFWTLSPTSKQDNGLDGLIVIAGVLIVYVSLTLLFYPGVLGPDVTDMIWSATQFRATDKYSYLGALYTLGCLSVFPDPRALYGVTFVIFAAVLLYLHAILVRLEVSMARRTVSLGLLACSPYALFTSAYINRDTYFVYAFCLVCLLIWSRAKGLWKQSSVVDNAWLGVAIAAFCALRPEAVVVFPIYVLILVFTSKTFEARASSLVSSIVSFSVLVAGLAAVSPSVNKQPTYSTTAYLNPVVAIVTHPGFQSPNSNQDRADIGRVLDLDRISQRDFRNIPSYFNGAFNRNATQEEQEAFRRASMRIIANNLDIFVANRFQVFAVASGFSQRNVYFPTMRIERQIQSIVFRFPFAAEANKALLGAQNTRLDLIENQGAYSLVTIFLWNLMPALSLTVLMVFFWTAAPITALLAAANLARAFIVFLTAPATFTMYYSTVQMGTWLLVVLFFCELKLKQNKQTAQKRHDVGLFATLSGVGWMFDLALFTTLVGIYSFSAMTANLVSATIAATTVFVIYGALSKRNDHGASIRSIFAYVIYQVFAIIVFSWLIDRLASTIDRVGVIDEFTTIAFLSKIIVTALNFLSNYIVSRLLLSTSTISSQSHVSRA